MDLGFPEVALPLHPWLQALEPPARRGHRWGLSGGISGAPLLLRKKLYSAAALDAEIHPRKVEMIVSKPERNIKMLLVGIVALGLGVMVSIGLRQAVNKSQVPARTSLDWGSVREGMTKEEVLRIVGKPMRIQDYPEAGMTEWWYMESLENLVEGMQSGGG